MEFSVPVSREILEAYGEDSIVRLVQANMDAAFEQLVKDFNKFHGFVED